MEQQKLDRVRASSIYKQQQGTLRSRLWACVFVLCLSFLASVQAKAQTLYGSVVGTVTDDTGAAVPEANVVITETQTNEARTVTSDGGGVYTVSTVPPGNYQVVITKAGFQGFKTIGIEVTPNNVVRVDAKLQVGTVSQTVEVQSAVAAQLQTDTADVHSEISSHALESVPQATRSYQGILNQVPGVVPPGGQLSGGTNNPSKSMQFAANGTGVQGPNVRIEGVSATNPWVQQYTSFVPSIESIQSINVVTNSPDAEQGLSGGPSVTVQLKSGSNSIHGGFYEYNTTSATEARGFFQPTTQKAAHLVDNNTGGFVGGPIIKDKLFYFAGYEGDYIRQGYAGIISVPTPQMLSGDLSGSTTPIYDPATGNADGTGRTAFPGNKIPANRISNVAKIMIPYVPAPNIPGLITNNFSVVQATIYNLHKIDTKIDYQITPKLRVSGRYGYQPYFNQQSPFFGQFLGGSSGGWPAFSANGAGNYLQNGATLAVSGSVTYLFSPSLIVDGTFGVTQPHQLLFPTNTNVKVGLDVLGIPGTNIGALPWSGGMPDFDIASYPSSTGVTFGYSYPPLEYKDPVFEYAANVTKIKGSHNIRVGEDIVRLHMNHKEVRNTVFQFTGGVTATPGGASPNPYNGVADYLLGLPQTTNVWFQPQQPYITLREYDFSVYARDQWQATHKLTINYGLRYEYFPVPTTADRGIQYNNLLSDINNPTMELCGVGGNPGDCGIKVSKTLFAPSLGVAFRLDDNTVVRAGYALSPTQVEMGNSGTQAFPATVQGVYNGTNGFLAAPTTLATGFPTIPNPVADSHGNVPIPFGAGNVNTVGKNFRRGYIQSYNLNVQRSFAGFVGQIGYVGTHVVNQNGTVNFNYAQLGGGTASLPLNRYGITGAITEFKPANWDRYNSLQATLARRLTNGFTMQMAYTYSKDMQGGATAALPSGGAGIQIPQYYYRNTSVTPVDRTHNFIVSSQYELPFGKNKQFVTSGIGAVVLGGWSLQGTFYHLSGLPFSVNASNSSCNCPNSISTQLANRVKSNVAKGKVPHQAQDGSSWFDPTAFAPVTTATFGNSSFNSLRGPGATQFDSSVFRQFQIWERLSMQFRAESLNTANHPHFGNPSSNISSASIVNGNITALNGYSQITTTNPLGRLLDARYFRFGVKFLF